MKIKFFQLLFPLLLLVLSACVKEFRPSISTYEDLLVVDGMITDAPGPYTITLSKTSPIKEFSPIKPYSNCTVEIKDDQGNQEILTEVAAGVYKTDSLTGLQGIVGRKYKCTILTPGGERYESEEQLIKKDAGIKSVYAEVEHHADPKFFYGRNGYQFFVDIEKPLTDSACFLWQLECTYKFNVDTLIYYYYEGGGVIKPFSNHDSLLTCYRTEPIKKIYVLNTTSQSEELLTRFPLNYEDNYSEALRIRYSLNVTQLTINRSAYTYWNSLKKIMENQGELYAQQPYQVKSNVINVRNPDKPALGFFMAAGLSEKRVFVDKIGPPYFYDTNCGKPVPPFDGDLLSELLITEPADWPIYLFGLVSDAATYDQKCIDCRKKGILKKPDFWVE